MKENKKRKNIDEDIDLGRFFEIATTNRNNVNGLNLHEIRNEILEGFTGDFELFGSMLIGGIEQKTYFRFKIVDDSETYFNSIDNGGYDSEDVLLQDGHHKLNTPEFNKVNRCQYGKGTDFKHVIVDCIGNKCFIPTSVNCFIKCNNYLTGKDYTEEFLIFFRTERKRSKVMTSGRFQPFFRKNDINIGHYDGFRIYPRNITERNIASKMHINHFCLLGKSQNLCFNQAINK